MTSFEISHCRRSNEPAGSRCRDGRESKPRGDDRLVRHSRLAPIADSLGKDACDLGSGEPDGVVARRYGLELTLQDVTGDRPSRSDPWISVHGKERANTRLAQRGSLNGRASRHPHEFHLRSQASYKSRVAPALLLEATVKKTESASRTSSIFLVNPSLFSTSQIHRVGWRWLSRRCFGASQGQSWGQLHLTMSVPVFASKRRHTAQQPTFAWPFAKSARSFTRWPAHVVLDTGPRLANAIRYQERLYG